MTSTETRLPALPTEYDGLKFRSRTEARWAVVFKTLGIVYDYETEGFLTDGEGYLPDFLLPGQSLIGEVKPSVDIDPDGVRRWRALVEARGKERGVLLTPIRSGETRFLLIGPDGRGGLWECDNASLLCCPGGYHFDFQPWPQIGCEACRIADGYWYDDKRIAAAFSLARSYKFGRAVTGG